MKKRDMHKLTVLPPPVYRNVQPGIPAGAFDAESPNMITRAMAYISEQDEAVVFKASARLAAVVSTAEDPGHETVVLVSARRGRGDTGGALYKFCSNTRELDWLGARWLPRDAMYDEARQLGGILRRFDHQFLYEGGKESEPAFGLKDEYTVPVNLHVFSAEGSVAVIAGQPGFVAKLDRQNRQAIFRPMKADGQTVQFYRDYARMRDCYFSAIILQDRGNEDWDVFMEGAVKQFADFTRKYGPPDLRRNAKLLAEDRPHGPTVIEGLKKATADLTKKTGLAGQPADRARGKKM